ncbi:MAG: NUDIX domain-containing protein [bacterium]|nr:NUDIX domain-containing protein [bacterium]
MRVILVVERKHLFPGLSPQGFLSPDAVDMKSLGEHLFFAERDYMEVNSHYKQIIPYLMLQRGWGEDAKILCYQRKTKHTEARLGGKWSVGFGGHVEPIDRQEDSDLIMTTALRELEEETGLMPGADALKMTGFINSDSEDVSSVHFGVVFRVSLDALPGSDEEIMELVSKQAEPHQAKWVALSDLKGMMGCGNGPEGGEFEDWSRIAVEG